MGLVSTMINAGIEEMTMDEIVKIDSIFWMRDGPGASTRTVFLAWDEEDRHVLVYKRPYNRQEDICMGIGLLWQRYSAEIIRHIQEGTMHEHDINQIGGAPEQHLDEALSAIIKAETAITSAVALTEKIDKVYLEHLHGLLAIAEQSLYAFMQQHPDGYVWQYNATLR